MEKLKIHQRKAFWVANAIAAVFVLIFAAITLKTVCDGHAGFWCWLLREFEFWTERYQTFVTGLIALTVGMMSVRAIEMQIRFERDLEQAARNEDIRDAITAFRTACVDDYMDVIVNAVRLISEKPESQNQTVYLAYTADAARSPEAIKNPERYVLFSEPDQALTREICEKILTFSQIALRHYGALSVTKAAIVLEEMSPIKKDIKNLFSKYSVFK